MKTVKTIIFLFTIFLLTFFHLISYSFAIPEKCYTDEDGSIECPTDTSDCNTRTSGVGYFDNSGTGYMTDDQIDILLAAEDLPPGSQIPQLKDGTILYKCKGGGGNGGGGGPDCDITISYKCYMTSKFKKMAQKIYYFLDYYLNVDKITTISCKGHPGESHIVDNLFSIRMKDIPCETCLYLNGQYSCPNLEYCAPDLVMKMFLILLREII